MTETLLANLKLGKPIWALRFSPWSNYLAVLAGDPDAAELSLWECDGSRRMACHGRRALATAYSDIDFHPSGESLALGTLGGVTILSVPSCGELARVGSPDNAGPVLFCSSANLLLCAKSSYQKKTGKYDLCSEFYDTRSWGRVDSAWYSSNSLAQHPEGRILATNCNHQGAGFVRFLVLCDNGIRGARLALLVEDGIRGLSFSPDGRLLAVLNLFNWFRLDVYDFPSCQRSYSIEKWQPHETFSPGLARPERAVFSSDSQRLYYPYPDGHIVEADAHTGADIRRWKAHDGIATSIDLTPKGILATGGDDGQVHLWKDGAALSPPAPLSGEITEWFLEKETDLIPATTELESAFKFV